MLLNFSMNYHAKVNFFCIVMTLECLLVKYFKKQFSMNTTIGNSVVIITFIHIHRHFITMAHETNEIVLSTSILTTMCWIMF